MLNTLISGLGGQFNTIALAVLSGVIGFLAKAVYDLWMARRKDKLDRVNHQLRCLYGPLFSLVNVATITWHAFQLEFCENADFQINGGIMPQTPSAEAVWRHWMQNVFMPLNLQMAELITKNADLLEGHLMPDCLLLLSAHVYGYKGILAAWEKGGAAHDVCR